MMSGQSAKIAAAMTAAIPVLKTERLTLRAFRPSDFELMATFFASERSKFVGGPVSAERAWRVMATEIGHWQLRGFGRWAVDETATGKCVGNVGLWYPDGWPEPELGWDLFEGSEGKGYATEAAIAARDYAYEALDWKTAISLVDPNNHASRKVAERMGATFDSHFDHERYGKIEVWRHQPKGAVS